MTGEDADRLRAERARAVADVEARERDLALVITSSATEGRDDEHDPDGATAAFELTLATGLRDRAAAYLAEVARAIERLADGAYGVCEGCGLPIAADRLTALPTAARCLACASRTGRGIRPPCAPPGPSPP
jgi:DnaK suppressor protein